MPTRKLTSVSRDVSGRHFIVEVPATDHPKYGLIISARDAHAAELAIACDLALAGPVDGESFAFMRGALGVAAKHLAALLDVTAVTLSRWENSKVSVDRAAWITLGNMVLEEAGAKASTTKRLERFAAKKKPPKRTELTLPA